MKNVLTIILLLVACLCIAPNAYSQAPCEGCAGAGGGTDFSGGGTMTGDLTLQADVIVDGRGIINQGIFNGTTAIDGNDLSVYGNTDITNALTAGIVNSETVLTPVVNATTANIATSIINGGGAISSQEHSVYGDGTVTGTMTTLKVKGTGSLVLDGGNGDSIKIAGTRAVTVNPNQDNATDLTVYSNIATDSFHVDAATGNVGIGTTAPQTSAHIVTSGTPYGSAPSNVGLLVQGSASGNNAGVTIMGANNGWARVVMGDPESENQFAYGFNNFFSYIGMGHAGRDAYRMHQRAAVYNFGNYSDFDTIINGVSDGLMFADASEQAVYINSTTGDCPNNVDCVRYDEGPTVSNGPTYFTGGGGLPGANLYAHDNESPTIISGIGEANDVQFVGFHNSTQADSRVTASTSEDHIVVNQDGYYEMVGSGTIEPVDAQSDNFGFHFMLNDGSVHLENCHTERQMGGIANQTGSISISCQMELTSGDTIELWVWNDDATRNILVSDFSMNVKQMVGR